MVGVITPEQIKAARKLLGWSAVAVVAIGSVAWLGSARSSDGFSFESFEGDGSAARVEDAKIALERIVPVGSTIAEYDRFFRDHGGECWTVDDAAPQSAVCSYKHGFWVSSEWKYVVDYDRVTFRSKNTEINFGLTGL